MFTPVASRVLPISALNWMASAPVGGVPPNTQAPRSWPALSNHCTRTSLMVTLPPLGSSRIFAPFGPNRSNRLSWITPMTPPFEDSLERRSLSRLTRMSWTKLPASISLLPINGIDWARLLLSSSWTKPSTLSMPSRIRDGSFSSPSTEKSCAYWVSRPRTSGTVMVSTLPAMALPAAASINACTPPTPVAIVRAPTDLSPMPVMLTSSGRLAAKEPAT